MIAVIAKFFFDTAIGKAAAIGLLAAGLFVAWLIPHDKKIAEKAETKLVERSVETGKKANAKNAEVRRAAAKPGAAARLLKDSCRDCK